MPKFKFDEIEKLTSKGRLFPVYLIYGPEQYFIRLLVDKIAGVYKAESGAEIERHSAVGLDAVSVVDGLKTLPMWSKGKLVIISDASGLSEKSKNSLLGYFESASSSTILIITASKFDGRTKFCKTAEKNGAVVEVKTIYENQVPFWINRECRAKGFTISQEAAHFMTGLVGTDLSAMSQAVEKIVLYIGDGKKLIELSDVETVLSDTSKKSIFDLTNAAGSKDLSIASDRLLNLLRNNESPVVVVNMLARHWRLLLKVKELLEKRPVSERDMASRLGVHPFFLKDYVSQSKNFTKRNLVRGIKSLWRADVSVKSSRLPRETILDNLIVDMISS